MLDSQIENIEHELGFDSQQQFRLEEVPALPAVSQSWTQSQTSLFVGDNLTFLKDFASNCPNIVDVCYIDPPYNTGSKFLYHDNRKSNGLGPFGSHSAWMTFMLPRLVAARMILKQTGIIAISIDDYEHAYLKILMDQIFGEENFIGNVVVCRSKNGKGSKKSLASSHEYLLIYGKSDAATLLGQPDDSTYNKEDQYGKFRIDGLFRKKGEASLRTDRPNMFYPLYFDPKTGNVSVDPVEGWKIAYPLDSKGVERRWLWGIDTARKRCWKLFASRKGVIYVKNYAGGERLEKRTKVRSLWSDTAFYTERATNEITKIFGQKIFDTPKPIEYIKKIISICGDESAIVMDFFAGSGTTAHAVAELNSFDDGSRRCILMESNSKIPETHSAHALGFKKISDITAERLRILSQKFSSFNFQVISQPALFKEDVTNDVARHVTEGTTLC